jgi:Cellulase (glycosyl hydrolase family 5)
VTVIRPKDAFGFNENVNRDILRAGTSTNVTVSGCPNHPISSPTGGFDTDVIQQWQDAGVNTIRFGIDWDRVQPCSGSISDPDQWNWAPWTAIMSQLVDAGIHPIAVLKKPPPKDTPDSGDPNWAITCPSNESEPPASPLLNTDPDSGGLAAWRTFVRQVADRYGDQLEAIEVWNEENTDNYWGYCDPNVGGVEAYLQILNTAGRGINDAATNGSRSDALVPIILGSPFPAVNPNTHQDVWDEYLADVFDDWSSSLDQATRDDIVAVGLHPYRTSADYHATPAKLPFESAVAQVSRAKTVEAGHGSHHKPIWVTEVGTTTVRGKDDDGNLLDNPKYVGQWQAFNDLTIYDALRNTGVPVTLVHRYADLAVVGSDQLANAEYGFGAVTSNLTPKDTYCALGQERTGALPDPAC